MPGSKTILMVEDTADIRETLQMALELEGYQVLSASNGQEALDLLKRGEKPGLILLDRFMPIVDGAAFLEHLTRENIATDIPVVILAATAPDPTLKGVADWIMKPVDIHTLGEVIERWYQAV